MRVALSPIRSVGVAGRERAPPPGPSAAIGSASSCSRPKRPSAEERRRVEDVPLSRSLPPTGGARGKSASDLPRPVHPGRFVVQTPESRLDVHCDSRPVSVNGALPLFLAVLAPISIVTSISLMNRRAEAAGQLTTPLIVSDGQIAQNGRLCGSRQTRILVLSSAVAAGRGRPTVRSRGGCDTRTTAREIPARCLEHTPERPRARRNRSRASAAPTALTDGRAADEITLADGDPRGRRPCEIRGVDPRTPSYKGASPSRL